MKHHLLDSHQKIGWDIDGTLVDGTNSRFFHRYILANRDKEHHLITFRDEEWAKDAYRELKRYGIERDHIHSVNACPQRLYVAYATQGRGGLIYPDQVREFMEWKGLMASQIGCTALVDDMPNLVLQGCDKYGITFVNAEDARFGV